MKKEMIIGVVVGLLTGILLTTLIMLSRKASGGGSAMVSIAIPEISKLDENYLARVENYGISVADFTNAFELIKQNLPPEQQNQFKSNEPLAKAEILETMINQYAVVATAIEEGFLENEETLRLFRNAAQQALFNLYLTQNLPSDSNIFAASQPEIDQAYAQYGNELRARGMNAQQSRELLVSQISQQKRQRWMIEFVGKIKEAYRVERNDEVLKANNISTSRLPANTMLNQ